MSSVLGESSPLIDTSYCDWSHELAFENDLRIVLYCKNFFFRDLSTEWVDDMTRNLPSFLTEWDCIELLPEAIKPESLMAFIGTEQSRTPMHVDKLGTISYNLVVNGRGIKEWWFVHHDDTPLLEELISFRGGNLWCDNFWVDPDDIYFSKLRFYFVQQRLGDLVVVPPGVPHQVRNRGTTLAVSANIVHTGTVAISFEILERYRFEGVPSVYRLKTQVYFAMTNFVAHVDTLAVAHADVLTWFETLSSVFSRIVDEELLAPSLLDLVPRKCLDSTPHTRVCDRCFTDIFNRYLHCSVCGGSKEPGLDLCVQCANHFGTHPGHAGHQLELYFLFSIEELRELEEEAKTAIHALRATFQGCKSFT